MDKDAIARALREIAALLRLGGSDPFRAKAYDAGADAVEALDDLDARVEGGTLTEVAGIGKGLAAVIGELRATGSARLLEKLRADRPPGAGELAQVRGMTARRIEALHEALGVDSIASLRAALESGAAKEVRGVGEKTAQFLLANIEARETRDDRVLLVDALEAAERAIDAVRAAGIVEAIAIAGDVRRGCEAVHALTLVATARAPKARAAESAATRIARNAAAPLRAEVKVAPPARVGVALLRATGPDDHVAALEARARSRGVDLDALDAPSEDDVYAALGLAPIPPEVRDDPRAIARAARGDAADLVTLDDVRGMVHCHTVFSDGRATIEEMAREAAAMGMRYLTITDHSPAAHYAGGVDVDRLRAQWDEIDRVQALVPEVRLLRGTESDILKDGALDYPDRVLERLDVVIASVHASRAMDADAMTERIVRAMRHPVFKIWGHPLGRLVLRRAPIACDLEAIFDAIAESRAAIEINGDPYRLDLPPEHVREARARGIRFVVSVDAHSTRGMHNLGFGVTLARRAGLRRRDVLNTLSARDFARVVRPAA